MAPTSVPCDLCRSRQSPIVLEYSLMGTRKALCSACWENNREAREDLERGVRLGTVEVVRDEGGLLSSPASPRAREARSSIARPLVIIVAFVAVIGALAWALPRMRSAQSVQTPANQGSLTAPASEPSAEPPAAPADDRAEPTAGRSSRVLINDQVRPRLGPIKLCYERALKRHPGLRGRVKVRWTIARTGAVSKVEIADDTLGAPEVSACIKGLVTRWHFHAPEEGSVTVEFPFVFASR